MSQKMKAKHATLGAMITALAVIFLFFASIFPSGRYALFAIATFFTAVLVIEGGSTLALTSYLATGILAFLIIPDKIFAISYIIFYGYYGILKAKIEQIGNLWLEWLIKLFVYIMIVYLALFLLKGILNIVFPAFLAQWQVILVAIGTLVFYDIAYTYAIQVYLNRLQKMIQKAIQ